MVRGSEETQSECLTPKQPFLQENSRQKAKSAHRLVTYALVVNTDSVNEPHGKQSPVKQVSE
jgi:hypothetical protein